MKFTKKFWIILCVALVALLIAGKFYGGKTDLPQVDVESVQLRDIVERVSASGKIQPEVEVNITAQVSGQITALPVKRETPCILAIYWCKSTPICTKRH